MVHFIDHAIAMQGKISDATSRDMQSIINILIKRGDKYLDGDSERIMTFVQPTMVADYLDELIRFRNDWPDFQTAALLQECVGHKKYHAKLMLFKLFNVNSRPACSV